MPPIRSIASESAVIAVCSDDIDLRCSKGAMFCRPRGSAELEGLDWVDISLIVTRRGGGFGSRISRTFDDDLSPSEDRREVRANRAHHESDRRIGAAGGVESMMDDRRFDLYSNEELALLSAGSEEWAGCDEAELVGSLEREICSVRGERGVKVCRPTVGGLMRKDMGSTCVRRVDSSASTSSSPAVSSIG